MKKGHLFQVSTKLLITLISISALVVCCQFIWQTRLHLLAAALAVIGLIGIWLIWDRRLAAYRFVFPGFVVIILSLSIPMLYIASFSLTNFSSIRLSDYESAKQQLSSKLYTEASSSKLQLHGRSSAQQVNLYLYEQQTDTWYATIIDNQHPEKAYQLTNQTTVDTTLFDSKFAIQNIRLLSSITLYLPSGEQLLKAGSKYYQRAQPLFVALGEHEWRNQKTGDRVQANFELGQFEIVESSEEGLIGQNVPPNFVVNIGLNNYLDILSNSGHLLNLLQVGSWTLFAAVFTTSLVYLSALLLASLLQWPELKEREWIKLFVVACYGFPAFVIIVTFYGLFTPAAEPTSAYTFYSQQGLINTVLHQLFDINPDWKREPLFVRIRFLIVQFWLFFPFVFLLCVGALKAIPANLYEAAALEGAGVRQQFLRITVPYTVRVLGPVLVIVFANAFNDLNLVQLLGSMSVIPGSEPLADYGDLLVSYLNGIAFYSSMAKYALASSLYVFLFLGLVVVSFVYIRLLQRRAQQKGLI